MDSLSAIRYALERRIPRTTLCGTWKLEHYVIHFVFFVHDRRSFIAMIILQALYYHLLTYTSLSSLWASSCYFLTRWWGRWGHQGSLPVLPDVTKGAKKNKKKQTTLLQNQRKVKYIYIIDLFISIFFKILYTFPTFPIYTLIHIGIHHIVDGSTHGHMSQTSPNVRDTPRVYSYQ